MILLALLFLSLIYIFVKSLDLSDISTGLQITPGNLSTSSSSLNISQSITDIVLYKNSESPEIRDWDDVPSNHTDHVSARPDWLMEEYFNPDGSRQGRNGEMILNLNYDEAIIIEDNALQSLRRMQVICDEMRGLLHSSNIRRDDYNEMYMNECASEDEEEMAAKSIVPINTLQNPNSHIYTEQVSSDLEYNGTNPRTTKYQNSIIQFEGRSTRRRKRSPTRNFESYNDFKRIIENFFSSEISIQEANDDQAPNGRDYKNGTVEITYKTEASTYNAIQPVIEYRSSKNSINENHAQNMSMKFNESPNAYRILLFENEEFQFWKRLREIISRSNSIGHESSQNILEYYRPIHKALVGEVCPRSNQKLVKNDVRLSPEMSAYLQHTSSFPRCILKQEIMNLNLGPLVIYFGKDETRKLFQWEEEVLEGRNKTVEVNPELTSSPSDDSTQNLIELPMKTVSYDSFQSERRYPSNSDDNTNISGRLICYDSSFHQLGSPRIVYERSDKSKKKFDKYHSVFKKFENSEK